MFHEADFVDRCKARGLDDAAIMKAVGVIEALEKHVAGLGVTLMEISIGVLESYIALLVEKGLCDEASLMAMARYFSVAGNNDIAIKVLAYLLPVGVLPAMAGRLRTLEGDDVANRVLDNFVFPQTGAPPSAYPDATRNFVEALVSVLGDERAEQVLAWNVHGIPVSAFAAEREKLAAIGSVDAWLVDYHGRQVAELARHAADGTLWYEQKITGAVVEFVKANQEIQGGVRHGDTIYVSKIPYNPDKYLRETDPVERRRLACHCPLAASSIVEGGAGVPSKWCACSAGYTKFMFDVAFGEETRAEVLATALGGDELCRFGIKIPPAFL
jgi:hypothetical protein